MHILSSKTNLRIDQNQVQVVERSCAYHECLQALWFYPVFHTWSITPVAARLHIVVSIFKRNNATNNITNILYSGVLLTDVHMKSELQVTSEDEEVTNNKELEGTSTLYWPEKLEFRRGNQTKWSKSTLNHRTSSGLWNIKRTTAFLFWTLCGYLYHKPRHTFYNHVSKHRYYHKYRGWWYHHDNIKSKLTYICLWCGNHLKI